MLPKENRLKKNNDFQRVFKQGKYLKGNFINLKFIENNLPQSRFVFIIGLKISKKTVIRNKIRRRCFEVIKSTFNQIKEGFDLVFLPTPEAVEKDYSETEKEINSLLKKAKLLK